MSGNKWQSYWFIKIIVFNESLYQMHQMDYALWDLLRCICITGNINTLQNNALRRTEHELRLWEILPQCKGWTLAQQPHRVISNSELITWPDFHGLDCLCCCISRNGVVPLTSLKKLKLQKYYTRESLDDVSSLDSTERLHWDHLQVRALPSYCSDLGILLILISGSQICGISKSQIEVHIPHSEAITAIYSTCSPWEVHILSATRKAITWAWGNLQLFLLCNLIAASLWVSPKEWPSFVCA